MIRKISRLLRRPERPQPQADSLEIPHELPADFTPTPPGGLTHQQARSRKPNTTRVSPGKSTAQIILSNTLTLFNLLNTGLAVCLALVGHWRDMLFMGVVVSNALVAIVQELRARRTIRRLTLLSTPLCHALRNGEDYPCPPEELAEGDLIVLHAGDQVVADAIVTDGQGAVNESLLTGESDAVPKAPGDWLLSGSYISEGSFTAQLVHVGDDAYAARLTRAARRITRPRSALMTELGAIVRYAACLLIPLGALLFLKQYFLMHLPLEEAVPSTAAAMIGMIPSGLMLLTTVAMAAGVVKLGHHQTLVQELYGIETLARADVLCLDKTGTLTTGRMTVQELIPVDTDEAGLRRELGRLLGALTDQSGTLDALRREVPGTDGGAVATLPFSSARKKSAAAFPDGTVLALGAPDFVLPPALLAPLAERITALTQRGCRVLVLARATGGIRDGELPLPDAVLGLCVLADEVRPTAAQTLAYFREQGVSLRVISGDDPRTVSAIARQLGLEGDAVDTSRLNDEELQQACRHAVIFGRVSPVQKKTIVETLKAMGHKVAMTGDGVNDIPALKAADCSIAMAGGADAAKHAAQLTLLNADFASLPLVVGEGRRVVGNITRAAALFLVKTLYSFALTALLLALPSSYPFYPIQLTLVSSLTIGVPSFFLALEPNQARITGRFLHTVLRRAIPGAAAVTVCAALSMLGAAVGWTQEACNTLATLGAGVMGLVMLLRVCLPLTRMRLALWCAMAGVFTLAVLLLGHLFYLVTLSGVQLLALAGVSALALAVMALCDRLLARRLA